MQTVNAVFTRQGRSSCPSLNSLFPHQQATVCLAPLFGDRSAFMTVQCKGDQNIAISSCNIANQILIITSAYCLHLHIVF